jgi:hypothetical protein
MPDTAVAPPDPADVRLCREMAAFYRIRGLQPLPSRMDEKRPLIRYAEFWEKKAPDDLFDRFETHSLQVMTGRYWRLLVIDLDGPGARAEFDRLARDNRSPIPPTWVTHSGGDGIHLWFRLAPGIVTPLPRAVLWEGDGGHAAIERLCDRSLVMAPPSIHPVTGARYRFLDRSHSPVRLALPSSCPGWILGLAPIERPKPEFTSMVIFRPARVVDARGARYRAADVIEGIPDILSLVASWGVRLASSRANGAGWVSCHAISREDRHPSASVSALTGRYWEPGERTISLFELGCQLGIYLDVRDAIADLGRHYRIGEAG